MPFCTQCGGQVGDKDVFCATCGAKQGKDVPGGAGPNPYSSAAYATSPASGAAVNDPLASVSDRNAAILCYIPWVGWVASIVVLASQRFRDNRDLRFNAFQGLYLFVLWLFVDWIFAPLAGFSEATRILGRLGKFVVFGTWIFMIIQTAQGRLFRLPVIGELAERSVSEQK
jgi:uncharacterized membrane protein